MGVMATLVVFFGTTLRGRKFQHVFNEAVVEIINAFLDSL
jgi:hypothetical protein